jgi:hypothetical protein
MCNKRLQDRGSVETSSACADNANRILVDGDVHFETAAAYTNNGKLRRWTLLDEKYAYAS